MNRYSIDLIGTNIRWQNICILGLSSLLAVLIWIERLKSMTVTKFMEENLSSQRLARHLGHDPAPDQNPEEDPSHALDPVTVADHDLSLGLDQDQEIVSGQKNDEDGLDRDLNPGLRSKLTEWEYKNIFFSFNLFCYKSIEYFLSS